MPCQWLQASHMEGCVLEMSMLLPSDPGQLFS